MQVDSYRLQSLLLDTFDSTRSPRRFMDCLVDSGEGTLAEDLVKFVVLFGVLLLDHSLERLALLDVNISKIREMSRQIRKRIFALNNLRVVKFEMDLAGELLADVVRLRRLVLQCVPLVELISLHCNQLRETHIDDA